MQEPGAAGAHPAGEGQRASEGATATFIIITAQTGKLADPRLCCDNIVEAALCCIQYNY